MSMMKRVAIEQQEKSLALELSELRQRVVARRNGQVFTLGELEAYFDKVKNQDNWKLPIDTRVVVHSGRDFIGIQAAVQWFTGSEALVNLVSRPAGIPGICLHITARGYYAAVGA